MGACLRRFTAFFFFIVMIIIVIVIVHREGFVKENFLCYSNLLQLFLYRAQQFTLHFTRLADSAWKLEAKRLDDVLETLVGPSSTALIALLRNSTFDPPCITHARSRYLILVEQELENPKAIAQTNSDAAKIHAKVRWTDR